MLLGCGDAPGNGPTGGAAGEGAAGGSAGNAGRGGNADAPMVIPSGVVPADHPYLHLMGRWDTSERGAPVSTWNTTVISATFTGTSVAILLGDGANDWTYRIDDGPEEHLVTTDALEYSLAAGLDPGTHSVRIARRTEPYFGAVTFEGLLIDPGAALLPAEVSARRIEFIGDSITAGYGNEGTAQNRATQNGFLAFGPVAARLLGAEWHVEAISGIGMYRNYGDSDPPTQPAMPAYYPRTLTYDAQSAWEHKRWQPQVVVVALGTNDYILGAPQGETFATAYTAFLDLLRDVYPQAHVFCLSPFASDEARADIQSIVTAYDDPRVYHLDPAGDVAGAHNVTERPWLDAPDGEDYIGDWTHPTVEGHAKIAEALAQEIAAKLGW